MSGEAGSENNAVALSALQGELSVALVESEQVKAGVYTWIRLYVDEALSYVMDSAGMHVLSCPSCDSEQSGLKLNRSIVVPAGGEADFMIDINLAKSLNKDLSESNYKLRPTLRLVNLAETGTIAGSVLESLIPGMISHTDTGCKVYVYEGHGVIPDDYHDTDNVLTSAKVLYDSASMTFEYAAAFLPTDSASDPTPYTVALTCDFDDMEVDQNNVSSTPTADDVIFTDGTTDGMGQDVDLATDDTADVPFPPQVLPRSDQDAAGSLQAEMRCDELELRKGIARLSWTVAANQGAEQQVAVTIYRDGFETGNFEISDPLPPYQSSLVWDRVKGQAIHLWRVLTLQDEGWMPSVTERFEGISCVADFVLPPKSSK
jgi:hypothetical protein